MKEKTLNEIVSELPSNHAARVQFRKMVMALEYALETFQVHAAFNSLIYANPPVTNSHKIKVALEGLSTLPPEDEPQSLDPKRGTDLSRPPWE